MSRQPRIGVAMVVQNDAETVERAVSAFYPEVEAVIVTSDLRRGWTGSKIQPDDTLARVRALDVSNKVWIVEGDFAQSSDPMTNETAQRQFAADVLVAKRPDIDWVVQLDADEVFLDFRTFKTYLGQLPGITRLVQWWLIPIFKELCDGKFLVVTDLNSKPMLESFNLAHRPGATLSLARRPQTPRISLGGRIRWIHTPNSELTRDNAVLHFSWAKSERRVREKIQTFAHAYDFDTELFLRLWQDCSLNWRELRNFHPLYPAVWPRLSQFSISHLGRSLIALE